MRTSVVDKYRNHTLTFPDSQPQEMRQEKPPLSEWSHDQVVAFDWSFEGPCDMPCDEHTDPADSERKVYFNELKKTVTYYTQAFCFAKVCQKSKRIVKV